MAITKLALLAQLNHSGELTLVFQRLSAIISCLSLLALLLIGGKITTILHKKRRTKTPFYSLGKVLCEMINWFRAVVRKKLQKS